MQLSQLAWNSVTQATIEHCWKHTRQIKNTDEATSAYEKNEEIGMDLAQDKATRLETLGIVNKSNQMSISELLDPTGKTQDCSLLSPKELFQMHQELNDIEVAEPEDEPPQIPKPTPKEM
ncbi:hypothetical protein Pst134EA_011924 [Puccinia striiformis f. sp. tritici]|uniref:hypothetical protein n=1 Tax=Puccinia striiformis f. sp. tritici TaxID=168172 RepID=UPI002008CEA2|nr:hypothetical protein Pst134EA_011924 [Puccinia striiformis f. sp. tritici]KAH9468300.1 hypothetical protein Pst134EA_011924 [Puccinia striiformis f. sp. tritici]